VGVKIDRQGLAAALVSGERKVAVSGEWRIKQLVGASYLHSWLMHA
jgi:hypothetical protein